jgi:DNA-binding XRE family transcriptional regulator
MSDRATIRCPRCTLNQFETRNGMCRRCRGALLPPVSGACEVDVPNVSTNANKSISTHVPANELGDYADMQPIGASVGGRLRKARKAMRISQEEIAFRAHVTQPWVSMIERGVGNAQIGTIERYMAVLRVPLMVLLGTEEAFDLFLEGRRR